MIRLACDGEMGSQPHKLCECGCALEVLRDQPDERGHHASQAAHAEPYEPSESSDEPAGSDDTDVSIEVDNTTGDARPGWRPSDNDVIVTVEDSTSDKSDSSSSHWGTTSNPGPARVVARARATARVRQAANAPLARHLPGLEWQDLPIGPMSRFQQPLVARDADGCGCGICIGADAASALANPAAGNAVARSFAEFPFPPPELNIDDGSGRGTKRSARAAGLQLAPIATPCRNARVRQAANSSADPDADAFTADMLYDYDGIQVWTAPPRVEHTMTQMLLLNDSTFIRFNVLGYLRNVEKVQMQATCWAARDVNPRREWCMFGAFSTFMHEEWPSAIMQSYLTYSECNRVYQTARHIQHIKISMGAKVCCCSECYAALYMPSFLRDSHSSIHPLNFSHSIRSAVWEMMTYGADEWTEDLICNTDWRHMLVRTVMTGLHDRAWQLADARTRALTSRPHITVNYIDNDRFSLYLYSLVARRVIRSHLGAY